MELRHHNAIEEIDPDAWDGLRPAGNPFVGHEFLSTMEESGSATAETGWQPLHVTLYDGDDQVLVPNNSALSMAARPIREPDAVDMRARLPLSVDPQAVQQRVDDALSVSTKGPPHVALEEVDRDDVVVRVRATPARPDEGGRLAREVIQAMAGFRSG